MLRPDGPWLKDQYGRTLILRGVNLGGSSKVPTVPDGATHLQEGFFNHREVSFVGRPFPLEDAHEHFRRLKSWGLTTIRLLVTWEAIEHAGPGVYDVDYLKYIAGVIRLAGDYGLQLFIDPHQDVWSRFSGGDGAPGWTFEAVGMDITKFDACGAAIVHQTHGDPFPRMIWPSNSGKLAAATMFTLFFGGDTFAPGVSIEGEPVQSYLQRHYIAAIVELAKRVRNAPHVLGYDTMNEPLRGYIGVEDLHKPAGFVQLGASPSPFQSMLLGSGIPQRVQIWSQGLRGAGPVASQDIRPPPGGVWLPGHQCIWRRSGVWDLAADGTAALLQPQHFCQVAGQAVDFEADCYRPFVNDFARAIRKVHPGALIFIESEPRRGAPRWTAADASGIVYAPHWYDGFVLYLKRFIPYLAVDLWDGKLLIGARRIRRSFEQQLQRYRKIARDQLGDAPVLIGEFGIPFDLNAGRSFFSGDYRAQTRALDRSYQALDANLLSGTLWNYTADNSNARGDGWNGEDLSIFSRDQQDRPDDINAGGRGLAAVVRPYARAVAGEPLEMSFDLRRRVFRFVFRHEPSVSHPTEIFIPGLHYPRPPRVEVSDGSFELHHEQQLLIYHHTDETQVHKVVVMPRRA
jgi:hypothetical protein